MKNYWLNKRNWQEFYEMIDQGIKGNRRCKDCGERLWLSYMDGHVADNCLTFECQERLKFSLDMPGYVTSYDVPIGPVPDHIEVRDIEQCPWAKPHERYYRLKYGDDHQEGLKKLSVEELLKKAEWYGLLRTEGGGFPLGLICDVWNELERRDPDKYSQDLLYHKKRKESNGLPE